MSGAGYACSVSAQLFNSYRTTRLTRGTVYKKVRGLLAAALLVVALVLPIIENSTLGYAAEAQVSSFQFRYPNSVTFEEIN